MCPHEPSSFTTHTSHRRSEPYAYTQSNLQAASFSGLLGLGGGWLALSGLSQFHENANRLGAVGLTDLVAFRSRLITPPSPWIPGEWFTLLLLMLPFACVGGWPAR